MSTKDKSRSSKNKRVVQSTAKDNRTQISSSFSRGTARSSIRRSRSRPPEPTLWMNEKRRLAHQYGWIPSLATDNPIVDAIAYSATKSLENAALDYDPYQIEALLSSASARLDRCLVYRREMNDLEEQAVRRALEYDLFKKQLNEQLGIELAEHIIKQRQVEKTGQSEAATSFRQSNAELGPGFAAISEASSKSSEFAIEGEQTRVSNVTGKWKAFQDHQLALQSRHETPGHALNYQNRFDIVRRYFESDLAIAYKKARCISFALERIYGIADRLQAPSETGYLDYLVQYVRSALERIEIKSLEEIEFEHLVSIRQPRALHPNSTSTLRYMTDAEWNAALEVATGTGRLVIDLQREFPSTIKRLRVRGIAASMLGNLPTDQAARQRTTSVVVFPPSLPDWSGTGKLPSRSPIILERVGPSDLRPSPGRYTSIMNLDPRGVWELQISTNLLWSDALPHGRWHGNILDIKLHLSLAATLESDPQAPGWRQYYF